MTAANVDGGGQPFQFDGYADGLAYIDGRAYRQFASPARFTEGFMDGRTFKIDLLC